MIRRGPTFCDALFPLVLDGTKTNTRRTNIKGWKNVKKGDLLWLPEKLLKTSDGHVLYDRHPTGLVEYTYPPQPPRLALWEWKPDRLAAMYCPRWAARYWVRATEDARIERLQDIGQGAACKEGCPPLHEPIGWFSSLWDSLNKTPGKRWADNPPVVRLAFEPCVTTAMAKQIVDAFIPAPEVKP